MFESARVRDLEDDGGHDPIVTVSARLVAAEIRRRVPGVGAKKVHKLLSYCQAHHLATSGLPAFSESLSAWDLGPVVGQLWRAEKDDPGSERAEATALADEALLNTIRYVVSRYGRLSARDLEHMTHAEDPWRRADEERPPSGTARIRNDWILEYFRSVAGDEDGWSLDGTRVAAFLAGADDRRRQSLSEDTAEGIRARAR